MRRLTSVSRNAGFTLVELMVALALAALISVSIMFISNQARMTYDETIKKVDVYTRFRFVLRSLDIDIRNWIPTSELEFYIDGRGRGAKINGHWDPGEESQDRTDEWGPGVLDGGTFVGATEDRYDEFATITQRHYTSREKFQNEEKRHDAYQLYFRTVTFIDGAMRVANVEYMLLDPNYAVNNGDERGAFLRPGTKIPAPPKNIPGGADFHGNVAEIALFKIVRYVDLNYKQIEKQAQLDVKRSVVEVCSNVTDFKVEYLVDRDSNGRVKPGFRTPEEDYKSPAEPATRPVFLPEVGVGGAYRKSFGYGSAKLDVKFDRATAYPAKRGDDNLQKGGPGQHEPVRFGFRGNPNLGFNELTPGDRIFIFTASERGGALPVGGAAENQGALIRFPAKDYTVKNNFNGLLELEEDLDSTEWRGQPKNEMYYKAGFLPAAVRVTLRIVDDKGENPKTLQRVIWLRRRTR